MSHAFSIVLKLALCFPRACLQGTVDIQGILVQSDSSAQGFTVLNGILVRLVNVNVKLTLEPAMKAQRGSRCISLLFL